VNEDTIDFHGQFFTPVVCLPTDLIDASAYPTFNMNFEFHYLFYALAGYLIGSVSTAIITCKLMGLDDPRNVGSNNPGATNVLRHGGKKAAIITLIGDMLKGLFPVIAVTQIEPVYTAIALTGLGAFFGHIFPVYYGFKGGKGVATYYGVLLGYSWLAGLAALLIWLLTALASKISSLSALVSALCAPLLLWQVTHSTELTITLGLMTALLYWRHRSNVRNIIAGREHKIGVKKDFE
jgi:glycerol-3-phosphate acyltransferase PlsY